eukprot:CAMPEP_0118714084 /NCGR_PEP_ID=MMETSP0800-20121206/25947_1 /TAXON_ID=210618 ORGANISM="Striatella unipunctata, Strain CCMP2910" /NCGR_SAMPLE_ID=MMETSP0800 /ASSEMBLY_ACC=CAM_ASM_000638 /LENGTH=151 /DNA_ID=CAMNT_0006619751 /DNA_START=22 /DNA_END=477 /DNA_ORIENTATION=-
MDRREVMGKAAFVAAGLVGLPALANADGSVSFATIGRARGIYGGRVAGLKSAVEKGDLAAIAEDQNAFILFNSGVYARDKPKLKAANAKTAELFKAVNAGDTSAVKSIYAAYIKENEINPLPAISSDGGQGYSCDYDYRARTSAGADRKLI